MSTAAPLGPESGEPGPGRGRRGTSPRIAVGLLVAGTLILLGASRLPGPAGSFGPGLGAPLDVHLRLDKGEYAFYEQTASTNNVGPVTTNVFNTPTLTPDQVTVSGEDGQPLAVHGRERFARDAQTVDDATYTGRAWFDVPRAGSYHVVVSDTASGDLLLRPTDAVSWPSLLTSLAGGVVFLVGIVLLARRRRPRAAAATPGLPLPVYGWYPDPDPARAGRLRYWDGRRWTEHVR